MFLGARTLVSLWYHRFGEVGFLRECTVKFNHTHPTSLPRLRFKYTCMILFTNIAMVTLTQSRLNLTCKPFLKCLNYHQSSDELKRTCFPIPENTQFPKMVYWKGGIAKELELNFTVLSKQHAMYVNLLSSWCCYFNVTCQWLKV